MHTYRTASGIGDPYHFIYSIKCQILYRKCFLAYYIYHLQIDWGLDKNHCADTIFKCIISNELTISQHWLCKWLGAKQVADLYHNQWRSGSLMHICVTGPQCVKDTWKQITDKTFGVALFPICAIFPSKCHRMIRTISIMDLKMTCHDDCRGIRWNLGLPLIGFTSWYITAIHPSDKIPLYRAWHGNVVCDGGAPLNQLRNLSSQRWIDGWNEHGLGCGDQCRSCMINQHFEHVQTCTRLSNVQEIRSYYHTISRLQCFARSFDKMSDTIMNGPHISHCTFV